MTLVGKKFPNITVGSIDKTGKKKSVNILEEAQKNIAVQYFLLELPIMTHSTNILELESCDFVYHTIPKFFLNTGTDLQHLYLSSRIIDFIPLCPP